MNTFGARMCDVVCVCMVLDVGGDGDDVDMSVNASNERIK